VTNGLAGALSPFTNPWTTWSTAPLFALAFAVGTVCLALHVTALAPRLPDDAAARRSLAVSLALFGAAFALRLLWPERVHYTFNDEYEYLDHAQRLLDTGSYRLWTGPPAGVALLALAFAAFGPASEVAFLLTIVLASATPPVLYGLLRRLGVDHAVSLVAAVLLVVMPLHVKHSASASIEIPSLLLLLGAIGTFTAMLRAPGWLNATSLATCLFLALTVRVENWALAVVLPVVAWRLRDQVRRPRPGQLALVALAVVLAAAYVPGILDAPIRYSLWWKSRLPPGELLLVNLGFWIGPEPALRKLALLLAMVGFVSGDRRNPTATLVLLWLALVLSVLFVLYGLNIGWLEEAHQPPPWGVRGAGHDMFRFDVLLLPAFVLLLANGVVALVRAVLALLRGSGAAARWPRRVRLGVAATIAALPVVLLGWRGEWRSYAPIEFVASPYNRRFEIKELRVLRDMLSRLPRGARLYVLPPTEGVWIDGIAARPLATLPTEVSLPGSGPAYVYVNGRQLAVAELRRAFESVSARVPLRDVESRVDVGDRFLLLVAAPPAAAAQPARQPANVQHPPARQPANVQHPPARQPANVQHPPARQPANVQHPPARNGDVQPPPARTADAQR